MTKSEPRVVFVTARGKKVVVTFVHTDNYTVIAEITADNTPGVIKLVRDDERSWVVLDDNLDRVRLFDGAPPSHMPIDVEETYRQYLTEQFVT